MGVMVQGARQQSSQRWLEVSAEVADVLLPLLANQQINFYSLVRKLILPTRYTGASFSTCSLDLRPSINSLASPMLPFPQYSLKPRDGLI